MLRVKQKVDWVDSVCLLYKVMGGLLESCCLECSKKHSEQKHTIRIIRSLYGGTVVTVSEP
jgi:hypothetical protein